MLELSKKNCCSTVSSIRKLSILVSGAVFSLHTHLSLRCSSHLGLLISCHGLNCFHDETWQVKHQHMRLRSSRDKWNITSAFLEHRIERYRSRNGELRWKPPTVLVVWINLQTSLGYLKYVESSTELAHQDLVTWRYFFPIFRQTLREDQVHPSRAEKLAVETYTPWELQTHCFHRHQSCDFSQTPASTDCHLQHLYLCRKFSYISCCNRLNRSLKALRSLRTFCSTVSNLLLNSGLQVTWW